MECSPHPSIQPDRSLSNLLHVTVGTLLRSAVVVIEVVFDVDRFARLGYPKNAPCSISWTTWSAVIATATHYLQRPECSEIVTEELRYED